MSDYESPDQPAFAELEQLVRHLGDELGVFRKRALQAEARLKAIGVDGDAPPDANPERTAELRRENDLLRARLDAATARARRVLDRVRFLRQQHELEARP